MNIKAYAKVNLTLDIIGKRPDGFHELRSVMAPISLFDVITVEKSDENEFCCDLPELRGDDNFCVRARDAFFRRYDCGQKVAVKLQKHIPYPAGLGGGSADAAAVLNGLNRLFDFPLDNESLFAAGAEVGSDVPFCMFGSPALCEGRGEIITPLENLPKLYIALAIGEGRLPTKKVFEEFDLVSQPPTDYTGAYVRALGSGDAKGMISAMGNGFTDICCGLCPEIKEMRSRLRSCGAETAILSGSGPAVYGVFKTQDGAKDAARELRRRGFFAYDCETL